MREEKSVYLIRHNGDPVYVGSTNDIARRRMQHISTFSIKKNGSFADYYVKNPNRYEYSFQVLYTGHDWEKQEENLIKQYKKKYNTILNASTLAKGNNAKCWRSCTGFTKEQVLKSVATRKRLAGTGALKRSQEICDKLSLINGTKIRCIETGEIFETVRKATLKFGTSHQTINRSLKGITTRLGVSFEKVED